MASEQQARREASRKDEKAKSVNACMIWASLDAVEVSGDMQRNPEKVLGCK